MRRQGKQHFDVKLEVAPIREDEISTAHLHQQILLSNLYWAMAQQLAHQTSNGTHRWNSVIFMLVEQFLGKSAMAWLDARKKIVLGKEPSRLLWTELVKRETFLEDGDVVTMRAYAEKDGLRIGFGE
ncbi:MAG: hypothetical protein R2688_09015 [Fimbriimonadaceae bacterium]